MTCVTRCNGTAAPRVIRSPRGQGFVRLNDPTPAGLTLPETLVAGVGDAVMALDLGRAQAGAVDSGFFQLAGEVHVVARLALGELQQVASLRLVAGRNRANEKYDRALVRADVLEGDDKQHTAVRILPK